MVFESRNLVCSIAERMVMVSWKYLSHFRCRVIQSVLSLCRNLPGVHLRDSEGEIKVEAYEPSVFHCVKCKMSVEIYISYTPMVSRVCGVNEAF